MVELSLADLHPIHHEEAYLVQTPPPLGQLERSLGSPSSQSLWAAALEQGTGSLQAELPLLEQHSTILLSLSHLQSHQDRSNLQHERMPWLAGETEQMGMSIEQGEILTLDQLPGPYAQTPRGTRKDFSLGVIR